MRGRAYPSPRRRPRDALCPDLHRQLVRPAADAEEGELAVGLGGEDAAGGAGAGREEGVDADDDVAGLEAGAVGGGAGSDVDDAGAVGGGGEVEAEQVVETRTRRALRVAGA